MQNLKTAGKSNYQNAAVLMIGFRYIYPPSLRAKVAEGWSMPSIKESWLPPDVAQPRIIQELRSFIADRTTKPQTKVSADVRSLKAVFEKLHIDESPEGNTDHGTSMF